MSTVREHLETILNLSSRPAITEEAEAALAIIDGADRDDELGGTGVRAMIYDPDPPPDRAYPRWTGAEPQEMP